MKKEMMNWTFFHMYKLGHYSFFFMKILGRILPGWHSRSSKTLYMSLFLQFTCNWGRRIWIYAKDVKVKWDAKSLLQVWNSGIWIYFIQLLPLRWERQSKSIYIYMCIGEERHTDFPLIGIEFSRYFLIVLALNEWLYT